MTRGDTIGFLTTIIPPLVQRFRLRLLIFALVIFGNGVAGGNTYAGAVVTYVTLVGAEFVAFDRENNVLSRLPYTENLLDFHDRVDLGAGGYFDASIKGHSGGALEAEFDFDLNWVQGITDVTVAARYVVLTSIQFGLVEPVPDPPNQCFVSSHLELTAIPVSLQPSDLAAGHLTIGSDRLLGYDGYDEAVGPGDFVLGYGPQDLGFTELLSGQSVYIRTTWQKSFHIGSVDPGPSSFGTTPSSFTTADATLSGSYHSSFLGPDIEVSIVSEVPEPSALVLGCIGVITSLAGAVRSRLKVV